MESQIATHNDADIILKLYDLRREEVLRKARHWAVFEFNPKAPEEFLAVLQSAGSQENAYFRQVLSISRNLYVQDRFSVYAPNSADDREVSHGSGSIQRQAEDDSGSG